MFSGLRTEPSTEAAPADNCRTTKDRGTNSVAQLQLFVFNSALPVAATPMRGDSQDLLVGDIILIQTPGEMSQLHRRGRGEVPGS